MNRTILVIGIICLLIGASVVSSMDNIAKDIPADNHSLECVYSSEEKSYFNTIWYVFIIGGVEGTGFYAFYPNGTSLFRKWEGVDFFSGGTWTNDGRYLCCMYGNGTLYDVDPETLEACAIGNGGVSLNGLAYNPVTEKLYGASSYDLYEIDIDTGNQIYIGGFGSGPYLMIAIAFDIYGVLYGWDVGTDSLWIIDDETGNATLVGPLTFNLNFAQDGAFDYDTDILYLVAFTASMNSCLLECDEDTGECSFEESIIGEATAHAISYELEPPVTNISFDPPVPDGENGWYVSNVTVTLNATDYNGVNATYYRINNGKWEIYDSSFILSEDGDDIQIDYYSVDNTGKEEDVKSAWLDIDKTPPNVTVEVKVKRIGWRKWLITIIITSNENTSGMDRVEFFLNSGLQSVVSGSGPTYSWSWVMYGDLSVSIKVIIYDIAGNSVVIILNSSDISYHHRVKDIFTQLSTYPLINRVIEQFPLFERFLNSIQRG